MKKYNADHFIKKFKAIPLSKWTTGKYTTAKGQFCALGHCGETDFSRSEESRALTDVVPDVHSINDYGDGLYKQYAQKHPRSRVLAALRDAKKEGK